MPKEKPPEIPRPPEREARTNPHEVESRPAMQEQVTELDRSIVQELRDRLQEPQEHSPQDSSLSGDFADSPRDDKGRIILNAQAKAQLEKKMESHKKMFRFSAPSLFSGAKTATEYDSKVANFSTRTDIVELENGQKVFAVYNYSTSWVHRALDTFMKKMCGDRMAKASSRDWKGVFEARSNVPIIAYDGDPRVVLMPYLPNMNAYDLFANSSEIKNFGPCPWAQSMTTEGKLAFGEAIVDEVKKVHASGKTWGETILPNMIITADRQPVIVDPETQYDADVSLAEQRARDVKDLIFSMCGALHKSEGITDYQPVVARLLARYSDSDIVTEVKRVVSQKPTWLQKIFRAGYETARLGISPQEQQKVIEAIRAY
ncbi:MAG: hypothetical protein Q7N87_01750 [Candidatus Uhrbacteria bacterium]|nr:hypothetical protein [Candidatus Uhrbacteria bacterium]MDP3793316.1 hypothetical protein [Candidatus Uhrbacteria bacterium]